MNNGTFEKIDLEFCQRNIILPVGQVGDFLLVAFANPFETSVATKIQDKTGLRVIRLLGREADIREKLKHDQLHDMVQFSDVVDQLGAQFEDKETEIKEEDLTNEESAPIILLANRIIEEAYFAGASDIHLEPWEKEMVVRYRIDGLTQEKLRLPGRVAGALAARIKIMCNLDIAERRLPQDGRIVFKQYNKKNIDIDLRVSTAPLNHGEGVVLRILDKQKSTLPLPALGFSPANLTQYRECIRQPYGAPPSAHSASRLISSCGIETSFTNEPNPFAAGHGGIFLCSTSSLIATAHGRASAYVRNENGATPPG
jgi:type IV pilus assembly protein PilB